MIQTFSRNEVIRLLSREEVQFQIFYYTQLSCDDIRIILNILKCEQGYIAELDHIRELIRILSEESVQEKLSMLCQFRKTNIMDIISELTCYIHDHLQHTITG